MSHSDYVPPLCRANKCEEEAIMAIGNRAPRGRGLITTIYQDVADAPKNAATYCGRCGVTLAASLAALSDSDLHPIVEFS